MFTLLLGKGQGMFVDAVGFLHYVPRALLYIDITCPVAVCVLFVYSVDWG